MPAVQSNFDASRLLHDDDCDIIDEYQAVTDGAFEIRRKFALIVSEARQLQTELLAKQAEIDGLATRHQQELSDHRHSAEITRNQLRSQGHRLRRYRDANKLLRRDNQQLANELEAARRASTL
nr:hypothetical protein LTR18_002312 [Exophiala xenobiotica]